MSKENEKVEQSTNLTEKEQEGLLEQGEELSLRDEQWGEWEGEYQSEEQEDEEREDEDSVYNPDYFISRPYLSPKCTLSENIIEFGYSFGYDCKRLFNLCVIDENVLIFASGNLIHFLNVDTGNISFRRSFSDGGIGHIATHPVLPHLAVGEKGKDPNIIIYEWPSFEVVTVLRYGTKKEYSCLAYNPDGELLCSQGGHPDYMLTIWNWRKHRILLRAKAYGERVFNARFSSYVPGHLTTSGTGHVKFWKVNKTFTGLKLQGELGRFGKTEICNIIGFLALPDEKVVTGCEWGNILVWDAGLIRVEVFRRGRNYCHDAPITQFIYNNGELMTFAMDGTIKIWYYETIELADPPEEDRVIEVEPIFEFEVGDYYNKVELMTVVKSIPDPAETTWFGQDGNGGIWKLDLSMALNATPAEQVYQCHAGHVVTIQASPISTQFATLGKDGRLLVYDYELNHLLAKKEFLPGGTCLLWLPVSIESSGSIIIGGFDDGVIRVVCVSMTEYLQKIPSPTEEYINLIQVLKPHVKAITVITANPSGTIVVTGSEDHTIFVLKIDNGEQFIHLTPIGFIPVEGAVSCFCWQPNKSETLLVGCSNGTFMEIELPTEPPSEEPATYLLEKLNIKQSRFVSVKGEIRRNQRREEILRERRLLRAQEVEEGEEEDTSKQEAKQEEYSDNLEDIDEADLPEVFVPPQPNPILLAMYSPSGNVWLTMDGYDAGYIYECDFVNNKPILATLVDEADDIAIYSYQYYHNNQYLVFGMGDGKIRVIRVNHEDTNDFSDYWSYSMHDNDNGRIYQICFNSTYEYMFTCGSDGNVFSYKFNSENNNYKFEVSNEAVSKGFPKTTCSDIDDPDAMSLEQMKIKAENELKLKIANAHKRDVMDMIKGLEKKYEGLLRRNGKLPRSQQLTKEELVLDSRVVEDLEMSLKEEMDLVKRKLAWNVEKSRLQFDKMKEYFINPVENHMLRVYTIDTKNQFVETFRLRTLGTEFEQCQKLVALKLEEQELKGRAQAGLFSGVDITEVLLRRQNPAEGLLKQIVALCGDYKKNIKLRRLLRKYRERKDRLETRRIEWHEMMKKKPNPNKPDPEDLKAIEVAKESIGDYKLKTAGDYKVSADKRITTVSVYDTLLRTKRSIYQVKKDYNDKVFDLRRRKLEIIEKHTQLRQSLLEIAKEIPKDKIRDPPDLPTYDENIEFPEKNLDYTENEIFEELPKRHKNMYKVVCSRKKELKLLDKEYEMLLSEKKEQKPLKVESKHQFTNFEDMADTPAIAELEITGQNDQINTPWEKEYRRLRVIKRLYDQDTIIEEMENDIKCFDEDLLKLKESKLRVKVDVKFLELFLLTVHQQLLILKKFEAAEEDKENKLFEKLLEKQEIQKNLNEIDTKIESRNREIRRCEEEIKNLVTSYYATIADNKFYDFLRRIFKKKYRPPKVKEGSESESESESSSSSEEEDAKSLDSKELGPIRLDETICPAGCDYQLYEWTFKQRSARHSLELNINEEKRMIELHKKENEQLTKKIKNVEAQYNLCQEDLEEFMREKQRNLNEIDTIVILNLNQIQNLKNEAEIESLSESVLFSAKQLTNLYKRVVELDKETNAEKQKHAKNCQHLMRMKVDVNHMKNVINKLTNEINDVMLKKFGTKVDIDDIEESLLKRLVAEMHTIVLELEHQFEVRLRSLREKLSEREQTYMIKVKENTERYNLLAVLEGEKVNLRKIEAKQRAIICEQPDTEDKEEDIEKLETIAKRQLEQIAALKEDIQILKMKEKPIPPQVRLPVCEKEGPEVNQKLVIRGFGGECEEVTTETKNELKDIYDEAQEIAHDLRDGVGDKTDLERAKKLTKEFIAKLPEKVQMSFIQKLIDKQPEELCTDQATFLNELVHSIPADFFLQIMDFVTQIMDTLSLSVDGAYLNI